jgi:hypothetical protein
VSYSQGMPDSSKPAAPEGIVTLGLLIPCGYLLNVGENKTTTRGIYFIKWNALGARNSFFEMFSHTP